jgi:DNA-binding response OmpR family regulator
MDNNRILVVDDEPDLTQVSTLALEYHGFKVDSFNDPQEALSKYKPGLYDLVILDIKMPWYKNAKNGWLWIVPWIKKERQ